MTVLCPSKPPGGDRENLHPALPKCPHKNSGPHALHIDLGQFLPIRRDSITKIGFRVGNEGAHGNQAGEHRLTQSRVLRCYSRSTASAQKAQEEREDETILTHCLPRSCWRCHHFCNVWAMTRIPLLLLLVAQSFSTFVAYCNHYRKVEIKSS